MDGRLLWLLLLIPPSNGAEFGLINTDDVVELLLLVLLLVDALFELELVGLIRLVVFEVVLAFVARHLEYLFFVWFAF